MSPETPGSPITSEHVRERARGGLFAKALRGYDIEEVNVYLVKLANQMELAEHRPPETRAPVVQVAANAAVVDQGDPYERLAERLAGMLRSADKEAERLVEDAHAEAERSTIEARIEADRVRAEAEAAVEEARRQAEEILRNAKADAEESTSTLTAQRDALLTELREAQTKLLGAARMLATGAEELVGEPSELASSPLPEAPLAGTEATDGVIVLEEHEEAEKR
jgi:F0F1-type ATP synthase membrane subunit b/b'